MMLTAQPPTRLQYRTTATTRRGNRSAYVDHDDLEGLPVRQWRQEWVEVPSKPALETQNAHNDKWDIELPWGMPKDWQQLPSHSQELLRAARSGRLYKRLLPADDDDGDADDLATQSLDRREKKDDVTGVGGGNGGRGTSSGSGAGGYLVKIWQQLSRTVESPTVTHLAKRPKNTVALPSKSQLATEGGPTVTRAVVRRLDAAGNPYEQTITLYEGATVDGEIIKKTVVPAAALGLNSASSMKGPNANGDLATQPAEGDGTPARRRPPPPKRRAKGFGRGRGRKRKYLGPTREEFMARRNEAGMAGEDGAAVGTADFREPKQDADNQALDSEMADAPAGNSDGEDDDGDEGEGEDDDDGQDDDDDDGANDGDADDMDVQHGRVKSSDAPFDGIPPTRPLSESKIDTRLEEAAASSMMMTDYDDVEALPDTTSMIMDNRTTTKPATTDTGVPAPQALGGTKQERRLPETGSPQPAPPSLLSLAPRSPSTGMEALALSGGSHLRKEIRQSSTNSPAVAPNIANENLTLPEEVDVGASAVINHLATFNTSQEDAALNAPDNQLPQFATVSETLAVPNAPQASDVSNAVPSVEALTNALPPEDMFAAADVDLLGALAMVVLPIVPEDSALAAQQDGSIGNGRLDTTLADQSLNVTAAVPAEAPRSSEDITGAAHSEKKNEVTDNKAEEVAKEENTDGAGDQKTAVDEPQQTL